MEVYKSAGLYLNACCEETALAFVFADTDLNHDNSSVEQGSRRFDH